MKDLAKNIKNTALSLVAGTAIFVSSGCSSITNQSDSITEINAPAKTSWSIYKKTKPPVIESNLYKEGQGNSIIHFEREEGHDYEIVWGDGTSENIKPSPHWAVFGNLLLFPLHEIGLAIDHKTGKGYIYPKRLDYYSKNKSIPAVASDSKKVVFENGVPYWK
jgi:hypothetical protein